MPWIDELFERHYPQPAFICAPFIARGGITLLHGKKSLGKSPFSWELARCVANGIPFLTFPTLRSKVLFIEKDTPEQLSMTRLQMMPEPRGGWWIEFMTQVPVDLGTNHPSHGRLQSLEERWGPFDFVIWNPLARMYKGTDRDVVTRVYDTMTHLFPQAGHLLISHDRKEGRSLDSIIIDSEEHSGWQEWVNLAQNVFRLVQPSPDWLELRHTGSQVIDLHKKPRRPPIRFVLSHGNSSISPYHRVDNVTELVDNAPGANQTERVKAVAKVTKKSERTIWRALNDEKMLADDGD